jgi:hypothetical protein
MASVVEKRRNRARPHAAAHTCALPEQFKCEIFEHPPCSPNLAPSDYHLFFYLRQLLDGQSLRRGHETKLVETFRSDLSRRRHTHTHTHKLVPRYGKCLNFQGNYRSCSSSNSSSSLMQVPTCCGKETF